MARVCDNCVADLACCRVEWGAWVVVTALTLFFALLSALIFVALVGLPGPAPARRWHLASVGVLFGVLAARLALAGQGFELAVDAQTFRAWAVAVSRMGTWGLYRSELMVDYPPVYLAVLGALGTVASWLQLGLEPGAWSRLLSAGPLVFEMGMAVMVTRMLRGWTVAQRFCAMAAMLTLPHAVANASLFGQVDAAPTFLVGAAVMLLAHQRLAWAAVVFALAILTKPIALFALPIGGVWALAVWWTGGRRARFELLVAALMFLATVLAVVAVAAGFDKNTMAIIASKYLTTVISYPYATLNAANLYAVLGWNWRELEPTTSLALWGRMALVAAIVWSVCTTVREAQLWRSRATRSRARHGAEAMLFQIGVLSTLIFCFVDQMHERYLYLGASCLVMAAILRPRWRGVALAATASLLVALNHSLFLDFHNTTKGYHVPPDTLWLRALGLAHLGFAAVLAASSWKRAWMHGGQWTPWAWTLRRDQLASWSMPKQDPCGPWERGIVLGITALAGVLGFWNLGSTQVPKTFAAGQGLVRHYVLDPALAPDDAARLMAFFGLGQGSYLFRGSSDGGVTWVELGRLGHESIFDAMSWRSLSFPEGAVVQELQVVFEAKEGHDLDLHEMALFRLGKNPETRTRVVLRPKDDPSQALRDPLEDPLVDEPHAIPENPSFLHEMYFDEVYHARSAWEQIQGKPITETSHPPLGKTLISWGISALGFNTLGWRLAAVLFGTLAVPLVWGLLRLASGQALPAVLASWFFCFDFLRHSQARIATLDTMALWFVLAALVALLLYGRTLQHGQHTSSVRGGVWLSLSGGAFALGVATKWSALYVAPVVAVLFVVIHLVQRREVLASGANDSRLSVIFVKVFCCFVALPLLIYFGAFYWSHTLSGEAKDLSSFWQRQLSMFRYHSELRATHPFAAKWWEWPFSLRPLWLYSGGPRHDGASGVNLARSLVSMGNPATWPLGAAAVVYLLSQGVRALLGRNPQCEHLRGIPPFALLFVLLCALGLYAPWVVSPRDLTFIYHYLPVVPFVLMSLALVVNQLAMGSCPSKPSHSIWVATTASLAAAVFVLFFPVLSGIEVTRHFIDSYLRWLPRWDF